MATSIITKKNSLSPFIQVYLVLEEDGTEVDDEEYFQTLPDNTMFMLLFIQVCSTHGLGNKSSFVEYTVIFIYASSSTLDPYESLGRLQFQTSELVLYLIPFFSLLLEHLFQNNQLTAISSIVKSFKITI